MTDELKMGWGWPPNAKKAHYFGPDRRSLCGKWAFFGQLESTQEGESPDDCPTCRKKLETGVLRGRV